MPRRETRATLPYIKHVHLAGVKISPLSSAVLNVRSKLSAGGKCIMKSVSCSIRTNLNFKDRKENSFSSSKATPQSVTTVSTTWNSSIP